MSAGGVGQRFRLREDGSQAEIVAAGEEHFLARQNGPERRRFAAEARRIVGPERADQTRRMEIEPVAEELPGDVDQVALPELAVAHAVRFRQRDLQRRLKMGQELPRLVHAAGPFPLKPLRGDAEHVQRAGDPRRAIDARGQLAKTADHAGRRRSAVAAHRVVFQERGQLDRRRIPGQAADQVEGDRVVTDRLRLDAQPAALLGPGIGRGRLGASHHVGQVAVEHGGAAVGVQEADQPRLAAVVVVLLVHRRAAFQIAGHFPHLEGVGRQGVQECRSRLPAGDPGTSRNW